MTDLTPPVETRGQKPYSLRRSIGELRVIDLACFRDRDAHTPGVYLAYNERSHQSYGAGRGLWMAHDGEDGWIYLGAADRPSPLGHALTLLPAPADVTGQSTDDTNTLDVWYLGEYEPSPITDTVLNYERDNLLLVGHEVLAYRDVQIIGENHYRLSGLRRGLFGTEDQWASHYIGEAVTNIEQSIHFQPIDWAMKGVNLRFRLGATSAVTDLTREHTYEALNVRPLRPSNLQIVEADGAVTITWDRNSRVSHAQAATDKPLPEVVSSFDVVIEEEWDPATPRVNRTLSTPVESVVYTTADQTDDGLQASSFTVAVYQRDATYGRGRPAQGYHARGG